MVIKAYTVNIALSECSPIANEFECNQSTPSKEKRARKLRIERTFAFSEAKLRRGGEFAKCDVDCISRNDSIAIVSRSNSTSFPLTSVFERQTRAQRLLKVIRIERSAAVAGRHRQVAHFLRRYSRCKVFLSVSTRMKAPTLS